MENKNGIVESYEKMFPFYKSIENFKEVNIQMINEKLYKNKLEIEDILQNDDCINDLTSNPNSKYKRLITLNNIQKLIKYCLYPENTMNKFSQNFLRFPYYSCRILCSSCVLNFEKSLENIKKANNPDNKEENKEESESNKTDINNEKIYSENENVIEEVRKNNFSENNNIFIPVIEEIGDVSDYYNKFFNSDNEYEEKFIDVLKDNNQLTDTSIKKEVNIEVKTNEYNEEDNKIIYSILDEIFKLLDVKDFREEQNCMGYFEKMVNYSLIFESDIILNYLFKDDEHPPFIQKFYKNLDKSSVMNILENLLNILADKDKEKTSIKDSKYILIIKYLWQKLINEKNFEKIETICKLTINTLITNSDKHLIEIIFKKYGLNLIKKLLDGIIAKEYNDKFIISILEMLCALNDVFLNVFNESEGFKKNDIFLDIFLNDYQKLNTFDYKYISKKIISNKYIFENYQQNAISYLRTIFEINNIIKQNIINSNNKINKELRLKSLYEWKFILSSLKIYIYSFYAVNTSLEKFEYIFSYKELFHISVQLYFTYIKNNLYQNIFIEIIDLICNEKCPNYLTEYFLLTNNNNKNLIDLIISNLENVNNNKTNKLLVGPNIEILKFFYYSNNKSIVKFLKMDLYEKYQNLYKKYITPKFERNLDKDYNFSDSELFINDNNDTFDGNDINQTNIKVKSIQQTIGEFLEKCKEEKEINQKKRRISIKKLREKNNKNIFKENSNIIIFNNMKEKQSNIEYQNIENDNPFKLERNAKFSLNNI